MAIINVCVLLLGVFFIQVSCSDSTITIQFSNIEQLKGNLTTMMQQSVNNSLSVILNNINYYDTYTTTLLNNLLSENEKEILKRVDKFKTEIEQHKQETKSNIVVDCLDEEAQLDVLAEQINNEVKRCATVASMETTNVISDSLNEAQRFMTIPQVLFKDLEECGLSSECLQRITLDALSESIQVPPKVMDLATKIQEITLRTILSVDTCALQGIIAITKSGLTIFEDVLYCINDSIDYPDA